MFSKFQLRPNSKVPLLPGWRDPENHSNGVVRGNYGVVCGPASGVVVLDYDTYNVPEKNIDLAFLKDKHGEQAYIVGTPKGGFHVYHAFEDKHDGWKNRTGLLECIDIRTTGGYVVGEGSKTENGIYNRLNGSPDSVTPMPDNIFKPLDELLAHQSNNATESEDFSDLEPELEQVGFTNIKWKNNYDFECDQRGKGSKCPLCDNEHRSNHFFVWKNEIGSYFVKNHSNKCQAHKLKSTFVFTIEEQAEIDQGVEEAYVAMKRRFEETVCMCKDQLVYVVETAEDTLILNRNQLSERFQDWSFPKGKTNIKFIPCWLSDINKRYSDKLDFLPGGAPQNVYNLWKGYQVEKVPPGQGDIEPFLKLTQALTGGASDYLLKWLARLFQKPGEKPITAPLHLSDQGTGKNSYYEFIGDIMGNELFFETANADNDIFGRFSTAFEKRKLVLVDEAAGDTNFANNSKLKALVTNTTVQVERKGIQGVTIMNVAGVVFLTNSKFPVRVEDSDRRFFAYECLNTYSKDKAFWDSWHKSWSKKPENQRAVFDYLMSIDISKVDWIADRPHTQVYQDMRQNCLPQEVKWLVHLIEEFPAEWVNKPIKNTDLFDSYARFVPAKYEPSNKSFGRTIATLIKKKGLVGLEKDRNTAGMVWNINRNAVFEWLEANKYTSLTELEEPVALRFSNNW